MKKQRGRKKSKILRGKIERDHYEGKSTTWTHPAVIVGHRLQRFFSQSREHMAVERERKRKRELSETQRGRGRDERTRWSGMKKVLRSVGGFVGARKEIPRWESRSKKPTVSAFPAPLIPLLPPLFVWPAVHKSSALDKSRKKMKGIN